MADLSPMMKQYMAIKAEYPDTILFFRLGDFYEMFNEDAILASRELELTLTGRDCGQEERAPMCGVPYHSCEAYIARLIKKGYKVAICEQTEDPAKAKGLVRREVVRIITPGTVIEGSMLDESRNNYIGSVYLDGDRAGICFADVSTGECYVTELTSDAIVLRVAGEMGRFAPAEMLLCERSAAKAEITDFLRDKLGCLVDVVPEAEFSYAEHADRILHQFQKESLTSLALHDKPFAVRALGALIAYVAKTQKVGIERLNTVNLYNDDQYMRLDLVARRNLELTETMRGGERRGSLLWVLDRTRTAMGKRLMRTTIERPLINPAMITRRLAAVGELVGDSILRSDLGEMLAGVFDIERLMTRIVYGSAGGRDLRSLCQTAAKLPAIKARLSGVRALMLCDLHQQIDPLEDIHALIDRAIDEEPPIQLKDGGVIKTGYHPRVDELRSLLSDTKGTLARIEAEERERTGIKNLKIGYNKVFGYYIEVTRSYLSMVPEHYIRKQTLTGGERYITEDLKRLEAEILSASEQVTALEYELFEEVRQEVVKNLHRIQRTASALAWLDVLLSLGQVAAENGYCCPAVDLEGGIDIKEGRHPVVEKLLKDAPFVSNDCAMDMGDNRIFVITGPNMAGKSTYMRQVAIITLMAQIGSFVPAERAKIGIVDAIFTRVGASDDLASGQSTFMVEMNEVASILSHATDRSLLILDEIGRGTSTYDGMSIARAVIEYIADRRKIGAKTLFATHYHELTELEDQIAGVVNYNIAVKKRGDDITFLRRIVRGGADESYGIEVAKLSGIPDWVVERAKDVLASLEDGKDLKVSKRILRAEPAQQETGQISFLSAENDRIRERLRSVDLNTLTPIEALNLLYELRAIAD